MSADAILKRLESLKAESLPYQGTWADCARNVDPMLAIGLNTGATLDGASNLSSANGDKYRIYDNTAADALRDVAAAKVSGLVPANMRWFDMDVQGEPDFRHAWLDDTADLIWREIHASNFDAVAPNLFYTVDILGQCALYVDYDEDKGRLYFELWPLGGLYFASSRYGDTIDTVYREYQMTAEQVVARYGNAASADTRKIASETPGKMIDMCHAIQPRAGGVVGGPADNKPIASVVVEKASRHVVQDLGYDEMPVIVPRSYKIIPNSQYAVGAVYDALGDIKTLNEAVRLLLQSAEMHIGGMWYGVHDGVMNPSTIKIGPRKVVMLADKDNFGRLDAPGNPNFAFAEMEGLRAQVRRTLMADRLAVPQQPGMTATEVSVRMELLRNQIAPMFGRLQADFLSPLITRCFGLLSRLGLIMPPPEELNDATLDIRYVSPLARSQRLGEVQAMDRFEAGLAAYVEVKPELMDLYDWDGANREKSWNLGVPQKFIVSPEKVQQVREQRAQAQQQAQQQQVQADVLTKAAPGMIQQ